jgi:hypothetical protein
VTLYRITVIAVTFSKQRRGYNTTPRALFSTVSRRSDRAASAGGFPWFRGVYASSVKLLRWVSSIPDSPLPLRPGLFPWEERERGERERTSMVLMNNMVDHNENWL